MYQNWKSEPQPITCRCGEQRQYQERWLGYGFQVAYVDGYFCKGCGKYYRIYDLLEWQGRIKNEPEMGR